MNGDSYVQVPTPSDGATDFRFHGLLACDENFWSRDRVDGLEHGSEHKWANKRSDCAE